jgi:hypothetical protein
MPQSGNNRPTLLSISQAAAMAGRSYSWARDCVIDGRLESLRTEGGRLSITTVSVERELDLKRVPTGRVRRRRRRRKANIRLVVDNTK